MTHWLAIALTAALAITPFLTFAGLISGFFGNSQSALSMPKFSVHTSDLGLLRSATHIDPNPAKGGGDITIAGEIALMAEGGVDSAVSIQESRTGKISLYVVREGDSLSQVAEMFDVSVNTIVWANNLRNATAISPGQTLVILPVSGVRYTVKSGDTLATIAKEYSGDAEEIALYNGLRVNATLAVGEEVIIPGGEMKRAATPSQARVARSSNPTYTGFYKHPLPGSIRTQGLHGYNAVDFGARVGTPILAAASGRVIVSREGGWNGGYGSYIVLSHSNGTQTLYSHNSSNIVGVGQNVVQGQIIGYVGNTGLSTGPHLHFEIRGATNPFAY